MGGLDIAGTNNNFGPILSQVINLPRYEPPPSDFRNDTEQIKVIGPAEEMLIDCYFKHFNYYLPVLSRKAFIEKISAPEKLCTVEVQKLLACVLATGFGFRREMGDPDVIRKMNPDYGLTMCRKFHHFNAQDVLNSSIENCQCYLILTGFYSSNANYDAVHNLVALAHSAAASLGLHRVKGLYYQMTNYKGVDHTPDTLEMGRRIFWCVVIVCSGYSLSHQSPFITSNDYDIPFPARMDSDRSPDFQQVIQDDFEGIKDLQHFVPMYEISSRVADITCTATKQRPHTKVDEVREMLVDWRTKTLPRELRITPTDMDAIRRQSRFSKFYHSIAYMFEICLHHTFQLHESHRELGIHGIWSNYCYDAAIAIKNIYSTRPMSRMNSHVILPVAAGAFANIVASKLLGKEESAQKYCDEIKLVNFFSHSYDGVTRNSEAKVVPFTIDTPSTPPWNEQSSSYTESSPSYIENTDSEDEEEEEEEMGDNETLQTSDHEVDGLDKRMTGNFVSGVNPDFNQQPHHHPHTRHHPSMSSHGSDSNVYTLNQQGQQQQAAYQQTFASQAPQHQRPEHPVIQTNYSTGYGMVPISASSSGSAPLGFSAGLSSAGTPGDFSQLRHQTGVSTVDSGFIGSNQGYALSSPGNDTYFVRQQHMQQSQQGFVPTSQGRVGLEDTELNAAQLNKIGEYRVILASGQFSQQEYETLMMKLQQEVILLGNPGSSLGQDGTFDYGQQHHQQHLQNKMAPGMYPQQQQQAQQGYPGNNDNNTTAATPLNLTNSQLLTGPSSSVPGTGFAPVDFAHFQPSPSVVSSHTASTSTANTSVTNVSSVEAQNSQLLGNSSLNTDMVYPTLRQPQQLPTSLSGVDNQMFVGLEYTEHDIMVYESMLGHVGGGFTSDGGLLGMDPSSVEGLLGGSDVIVGGADSLMEYMNDPELMMKEQLFSQVASNSVFSGGSQQQQQQQQQTSSSASLPSQTQRPQPVSYSRQTR
ncbi:hypothetical protein BG000_003311 [Podila horticola]|nr:hypothetical protein BG000_003311 [Podila horticola]